MNLSSSKVKAKKLFILLVNLTVCIGGFANDSIPTKTFLEKCKNSDAYLLYAYTDVTFNRSWTGNIKQVSFESKSVINTKAGVDEYAFLNLSNFVLHHLKSIRVQTLKTDGTIVKLDSSLILNRQKENDELDLVDFPIPGVEPGDTIEISYTFFEYPSLHEMGDFVNLFNNIPSLNTEYTIKSPPELFIKYKQYNGFPDPHILVNDTLIYGVFKMEEVSALKDNDYTCQPCELPYFYYSVDTEMDYSRNWKDIYNQEFNVLTQPLFLDHEKKAYYGRWKRKIIDEEKDSSKYYQFNLLYNDILENFTIELPKKGEFIKSSGYFLKEQRLDPISIRRLYRQILEDLNIKYWAVFARSKRSGKIDPYYIRKGEFDHIFFAIEKSDGALTFLYPHEITYKYQLNEIPTSLYNTEAVIVRPYSDGKIRARDRYIKADLQLAEVDSVQANLVKLPGMNASLNSIKQMFSCDVDIEEKQNAFKSRFSVSGGLSTDYRSLFSMLDQNKEISDFYDVLAEFEDDQNALEIDTLTNVMFDNTIPFTYSLYSEGSFTNSVTFLNDSLISITLDKLIQHSEITSEEDSIDLDYFLDYSFNDFYVLILNFSSDIELLSTDKLNKALKNNVGEYNFMVNLNADNKLMVQSNYTISKDRIDKSEYIQLKELNDLVEQIKHLRLLVKVL